MTLKEISILTALSILFVLICKNFFVTYMDKVHKKKAIEYERNMALLANLKTENERLLSETDINKQLESAMTCFCLSSMLRKSSISKQLTNDYKNLLSALYWYIYNKNNNKQL